MNSLQIYLTNRGYYKLANPSWFFRKNKVPKYKIGDKVRFQCFGSPESEESEIVFVHSTPVKIHYEVMPYRQGMVFIEEDWINKDKK